MSDRFNHSQRGPRRHRSWPRYAVLVLSVAAIAVIVHWFAASAPTASPSRAVAVSLSAAPLALSLPPASSDRDPAQPPSARPVDLASLSPAAGPMPSPASPPNASKELGVLPPPSAQLAPQAATPSEPPPWLRFAAAAPVDARRRARVAIVIDDLGLDRARTDRAIGLPAAVTLSFLAYSGELPRFTEAARRNGHEIIVHVPMEPLNSKMDMGPNGLMTTQPRDEVLRRLDWDLGRFDGYVGINNHMGSRFTGDVEAMGWVMDELKSRGLLFLDSRTIATSIAAKVAAADGVPFAERDVFLDDDQSEAAIERRLKEAEVIALRRGTAIAIGHPHDTTIDVLIEWLSNLPRKGVVLVPLTDIVKARTGLS